MKKFVWLLMLGGCTGSPPIFEGEDMLNYLPFDQNKDGVWDFQNEDTLKDHGMIGRMTNFEFIDGVDYYEVSYTKNCRGSNTDCVQDELIRKLNWSVRGNAGIKLEAIETPTSSATFDPPLTFVDRFMKKDEVVESSTGGSTYTSTLVQFGDCPVPLETFTNCAKIELASSDGVAEVLGTYWAINDFNIVAIDWPDQDGLWKLVQYTRDN